MRVFLLALLWPVLAMPQAVDCTPPYVTEAQGRCLTGVSPPCVLITWAIADHPAQCRLTGGVLAWWVGIGTTGTTIDPSSGQLIVVYKTWVPLSSLPSAPSGFTVK